MIRMIQSMNAGHAKTYFNDALSRGDYYVDDQELGGKFHGRIAQRLGLTGDIDKKDFYKLCDNINPNTNERLTLRNRSNRTIGYDINFHCPKSVSLLHGLGTDKRVLDAFRQSVHSTMLSIEQDIKTRVRTEGKPYDRLTQEMIWGEFVHQTARPVDNSPPDPHLHAHCYTLNVTWDNIENRYKAGQFRDIKRDMPYYQSMFHKTLATNLEKLGYETRPTEKAFEVTVIPQEAIDMFSKRTDTIGRFIEKHKITNPKELDQIGARTRAKKEKGYSMHELRELWKEQVKHIKDKPAKTEIRTAESEPDNAPVIDSTITPKQCIDYALEHCFERLSVVQDRKFLSTAIQYGLRNKNITINDIVTAYNNDNRIIKVKNQFYTQCTTHSVQSEEKEMINLARNGKGKFVPLVSNAHKKDFESLNKQQADALRCVLASPDQVNIIMGRAGTGKTTMMKESIKTIENTNRKVYCFAPTSESRNILQAEGFDNAQTISRLLVDKSIQKQLAGQIMWVDEAGMISTKDMHSLLKIADENKARLILSGDTRQHSSVERGDALRIIRQYGSVKTAGISQIYRQQKEDYKKAVSYLSKGQISKGFEELDRMGAIKERDPMVINDMLVKDYIFSVDNKRTAVVITPTHSQGESLTLRIREQLKKREVLLGTEQTVTKLKNKNLTTAQKRDPDNYNIGDVIQFSQHVGGIKRAEKCKVIGKTEKNVFIEKSNGKEQELPLNRTRDFDVYEPKSMDLSKGDIIRVTRNSQVNGERLDNGTSLTVTGFDRNKNIKAKRALGKDVLLPNDFGNINHGYVLTSHASQGKTVDNVYIVQPSATFPASNMKQFYVSVSRGRDSVSIYTDDKTELLEHVQISGDRLSATELSGISIEQTNDIARLESPEKETDKSVNNNLNLDIDEPEIDF